MNNELLLTLRKAIDRYDSLLSGYRYSKGMPIERPDYDKLMKAIDKAIAAEKKQKTNNLNALFDAPGPQLTEEKYGSEPSLRDLITLYYSEVGRIPKRKAMEHTKKYIAAITKEKK